MVVVSGRQVAIMAPTEMLARQHFETFRAMMPKETHIELLVGSTNKKSSIYNRITDGDIDVVIGTHALIQDKVIFRSLGLIVTDEQHRFGVNQRKRLVEKNPQANYLMMSATPIPRTMAQILYSDVDLSTIDELPKGRTPIMTKMGIDIDRIKSLLDSGQQGFAVFPMITESAFLENVRSIDDGITDLKKMFPNRQIGIVHGQLPDEEKKQVLEDFRNGTVEIIAATTVVEVGIDVPNATFMIIFNAERFGLSQLHQLRGRVGRGNQPGYCYLVSEDAQDNERLKTLVNSTDGFEISRRDLEIRGPGEVLGLRQHGSNHFLIGDFFRHSEILELASQDVEKVMTHQESYHQYLNELRKDMKKICE
jgi:ATP-dependent DNA helicase RecG